MQLSITVPYTFVSTPEDAELSEPGSIEGATVSGLGDVEIGVKYRFLQENRTVPQISFYPSAELPTGSFNKGIGSGRTWYRFPIWIQKSWGQRTTYGGGGYAINTASGESNFTFAGWLVEREIGRSSTLGAEIYYEGPQFAGDKWATFYNVGGEVAVSDHVSILMSAGHTVSGDDESTLYFGLGFQGGPGDR